MDIDQSTIENAINNSLKKYAGQVLTKELKEKIKKDIISVLAKFGLAVL